MHQRSSYQQSQTPEITVAEIPDSFLTSDVQFVDVREIDEWDSARMPGSIHIPLGDLVVRHKELDPNKAVIVICHSGVRSLTGGDILLSNGFSQVTSLAGGLMAWHQAGRPLER